MVDGNRLRVATVEERLRDRVLIEAQMLGKLDVVGWSLDLVAGVECVSCELVPAALRRCGDRALGGSDRPHMHHEREVAHPNREPVSEAVLQLVEDLETITAIGAGEVAPPLEEQCSVVLAARTRTGDLSEAQ